MPSTAPTAIEAAKRTRLTGETYPAFAVGPRPAKIASMAEPEMRNPFRNEADAFRILVMIAVAAAVVIAATVLIAPWLGAVLALVAVALGLKATIGWLRVGLGEPAEPPKQGTQPGEPPARP
jgi:hypothetical protein